MIQNKAILLFALSILLFKANAIDLSVYFSAPQTSNNFYLVETYPQGEILKFTDAGNIIGINKQSHAETTICPSITLPGRITYLAITVDYVFLMGSHDDSIIITLSSCQTATIEAVYQTARFKNEFIILQNLQNKPFSTDHPHSCAYLVTSSFTAGDLWSHDKTVAEFYFRADQQFNRYYQTLDGISYLKYSTTSIFQITRSVIDLDLDVSNHRLITCDKEGYITLFNFVNGEIAPLKESRLEGNLPCIQVVYRRGTAWALSSGKVTRIEVDPCWRLTPVETNKNIKYIYLATDSGPGTLRLIGDTEILTLNCHENCQTCTGPDFDECIICKDGSAAINGACCPEFCDVCSGPCCSVCKAGYNLNLNKICEIICHPSCKTCSGSNFNNCLTCKSGFYLDSNNACKVCHRRCSTCESYDKCTVCKT